MRQAWIACIILGVSATALAQSKEERIERLGKLRTEIKTISVYGLDGLADAMAKIKECHELTAALTAAGVGEDDLVPTERLRSVKELCRDKQVAVVRGALAATCRDATSLFSRMAEWKEFKANDSHSWQMSSQALAAVKKCSPAVDAVLAAGVPPDAVFDGFPIGDLKERVCAPLEAQAKEYQAKLGEHNEAELKPFRDALSGDKLALWESMAKNGAYGTGCKPLRTPADFANAKSWNILLSDTRGPIPQWTVRTYAFSGMKKVKGPSEKSGKGSSPPANACP